MGAISCPSDMMSRASATYLPKRLDAEELAVYAVVMAEILQLGVICGHQIFQPLQLGDMRNPIAHKLVAQLHISSGS